MKLAGVCNHLSFTVCCKEIYIIDHARGQEGFRDRDEVEVHEKAKRERGALSITSLYLEKKNTNESTI